MPKPLLVATAFLLFSASVAYADPMAIARMHDDGFVNAALACEPETMIKFYEPGAIAIYPGEGEVAHTKSEIEKLIHSFISPWCGEKRYKPTLKDISFEALPIGPNYIMIIRVGDLIDSGGKTTRFRATELIHKSSGKWYYLVDHASIGVAPESPTPTPSAAK